MKQNKGGCEIDIYFQKLPPDDNSTYSDLSHNHKIMWEG